jgi:hypothetical protein
MHVMPWHISNDHGDCDGWAVVKDSDGSVAGCHDSEQEAKKHMAALYANERGMMDKIRELWEQVKAVFEPVLEEKAQERAVSTISLEEMVFSKFMADPERHVWPVGLYLENDAMYAVVTEAGQLYRVAVRLEGKEVWVSDEWERVAEVHQPVGRTVIRKVGDRWRWFSVSATAVLNRVGEIDSRALFDSFIAHAEETGEYPARDFYHLGETFRTGQVDFLARDDSVLITSGLYDDSELARVEVEARQRDPDFWGDSIAYRPLEEPELVEVGEDVEVPVFRSGIMRFVSTVPRNEAASLFTMGVVQEVNRMLEGRAFEALAKMFGDENKAQTWLEENVDELNRAIEESGAITRAVDEEEPGEPEPAQETEEAEGVERAEEAEPEPESEPELVEREVELDEEALGAIVDRVAESDPIQEIHTMLESLSATMTQFSEQLASLQDDRKTDAEEVAERLAALEQEEDEKRDEWVNDLPRKQTLRVTHRPREANDPERQQTMADQASATLADMPLKY